VPVLLAVFYGPAVVVSMSCGIIIYYLLTSITATIGVNQDTTILINQLLNQFVTNIPFQEELLIFALVLVVVYLIRSSEINYAFNISIIVGLFLEMTLFLILDFFAGEDLNILYFILEIIACFVIAYVVVFFKYSLNFQHVERLQFEDDEYYYYVKAVPKHKVNAPERSVKHFRPRKRARHNLKELEEVEMFLEAEDAKEKKEKETEEK
jgi:hypothetical protein